MASRCELRAVASRCRFCQQPQALLCFNGLGISRKLHEAQCARRPSTESAESQGSAPPGRDQSREVGAQHREVAAPGDVTDASSNNASDYYESRDNFIVICLCIIALRLFLPVMGVRAMSVLVGLLALLVLRYQGSLVGSRKTCADDHDAPKAAAQTQQTVVSPELSGVSQEVALLLKEFRVRDALGFAERLGLWRASGPGEQPGAMKWLQSIEPMARAAFQISTPSSDDRTWNGPITSSGSGFEATVWYRKVGRRNLETCMQLVLKGSLAEVLALFREADLGHHCTPLVVPGTSCTYGTDMPAILMRFRASISFLPRTMTALVHRAFIDAFDTDVSGVILLDHSPKPEDITGGECFGMSVPPQPPNTFEIKTLGSVTHVTPLQDNHCRILFLRQDDLMIFSSALPNFILRRFAAANSAALAQRMVQAVENLQECGYLARIQADEHGFYRLVEQRAKQTKQTR